VTVLLSACLKALDVAVRSVTIYLLSLKIGKTVSDEFLAGYICEEAGLALCPTIQAECDEYCA
jgi:hypothetical protein